MAVALADPAAEPFQQVPKRNGKPHNLVAICIMA
jgi:hypothetical protein